MPKAPQFTYFLYHIHQIVQEGSEIWQAPIPLSRKPLKDEPDLKVSHGDYFYAARDFLQKDDFKLILSALSQHTRRNVALKEIEEIRIVFEKHGEFYHPARIEAILPGVTIPFVLNVAVSEAGKRCVDREFRVLRKLYAGFSFSFLPKVYGQGRVFAKDGCLEFGMFLGQWFKGYHEFHLSRDPADDRLKVVVWDSEQGNFFLTAQQTGPLYRQAAKILTGYFNLETFEHIGAWHHAAGDFVVKCEDGFVDVKLITVRQYGPMFANDNTGENENSNILMVLESLLVFFLNLAIRMRLDRLDGTGEVVWADKTALEPIFKGFLEGLTLKPNSRLPAEVLCESFRKHILSLSFSELLELNQAILRQYHPRSPDVAVVKQHLKQHVKDLYHTIKKSDE